MECPPRVYTTPSFERWSELAHRNIEDRKIWTFQLGQYDAEHYISHVRQTLGLPEDTPVVATGHQPELYHPGIWAKDVLLDRCAQQMGGQAVEIVVDTDTAHATKARIPLWDIRDDSVVVSEVSLEHKVNVPFVSIAAPSKALRQSFTHELQSVCATVENPPVWRDRIELFSEIVQAESTSINLAHELTRWRRSYEQAGNPASTYDSLYVSDMAVSVMQPFIEHICLHARHFATLYNESLRIFRANHEVRSKAQPFPDLHIEGTKIELPFWVIDGELRSPLFVEEGGLAIEVDGLVVPKAIALTMFMRLFVCDLFIHGSGGGRYDEVCDFLIESFWGVTPPAFVVASADIAPIHDSGDAQFDDAVDSGAISDLEQLLHRLQYSAEELLAKGEITLSADQQVSAQEMLATKAELVARMQDLEADRKMTGIAIKSINREMAMLLKDQRMDIECALTAARLKRAQTEVICARDYPYFLFDYAHIVDLVTDLLSSQNQPAN